MARVAEQIFAQLNVHGRAHAHVSIRGDRSVSLEPVTRFLMSRDRRVRKPDATMHPNWNKMAVTNL